jgi:hypothetical protein
LRRGWFIFSDEFMNGLPPIDAHDNKMLPVVYRRSDVARSANVGGRQSPQGRPEEQIVITNDGATSSGYTRSRNNLPAVVKTGNSRPKGMLVDVWV